jgi:anti-sigma regulatory factor (Ser/Thr protein kinase)
MEKRVLIERWLGTENQPLPIYDEASVSAARLRVREAGRLQNLSDEVVESVALIASELAHNHLSHARQGYFAVKAILREGVRGLEIIAADLGPGIERPGHAIQDSVPSERSLRAGLSAVLRIADEVEFDNRITEGTCVVARKFEKEAPALSAQIAIMGRPYPGEIISGDDAVFIQSESGFVAAVSDGLGHGPEARQASNLALEVLISNSGLDFDSLLLSLNEELSRTRGCAMSIARFNRSDRVLESVSAGDVHSHLYAGRQAQFFAGHSIHPRRRPPFETSASHRKSNGRTRLSARHVHRRTQVANQSERATGCPASAADCDRATPART